MAIDRSGGALPETLFERLELEAENPDAKKKVYLVTLPHSFRDDLVSPESLSKREVLEKLLDAFASPTYSNAGGEARKKPVVAVKLALARESHAPGADGAVHKHDHIAVLADDTSRCLPVKRAPLARHGLASP